VALLSNQTLNSLADEALGVTSITLSRDEVVAVTAGTSGTLYASLIALPPGTTVNNLDYWQVGAATTPTHQWMCLMTPGGVILAVTADNVAGQAANTYYRAAVTVPYVTPPGAPQAYYIGVMLASSGAQGTMAGGVATPLPAAGLPAGTLAKFVTGGAGLSTPPAVGAQQVLTPVAGTTANIYAATA